MEGKQFLIRDEIVTWRVVEREAKSDAWGEFEYGINACTFRGQEYDIICNGQGDCHILVNGIKRYLEELE